jgi:glucose/arabinose dehydrogenase
LLIRIGTSGGGLGTYGRNGTFRVTLAAVIGHTRRPGRLRGPAVLAVLALSFSLIGPSTLQAADPTPTPRPRPALTPTKDHEMFRTQAGAGTKASTTSLAATVPSGFHDSVLYSGLTQPTNVAFADNGRIFVAEKRGTIKVFDSVDDPTPTPYADLQSNAYNFWDRGLLGIALDPNFTSNGNVFALYTYNHQLGDTAAAPKWANDGCPTPPGAATDGCVASARLSRLHTNANGVWDGIEHVLVEDWCQVHPSHSIGTVAFGPDGALYVGAGDSAGFNTKDYGQDLNPANDLTPDNPCGDPPASPPATALAPPGAEGGALRAQDLRTSGDPAGLDGAILRLDPATGNAMPDNPLFASSDPNARRIVAYGFRNPFRFTFRPGSNELWIGDVGWSTWEEFNRVVSPTAPVKNFGWPCYEGFNKMPDYDLANLTICENLYTENSKADPAYVYKHSDHVVANDPCPPANGSVISGTAFYPRPVDASFPPAGGAFPTSYDGSFFFADYARNCIWSMPALGSGLPDFANITTFASGLNGPVDLKVGPDGALYYVTLNEGAVHRISAGPVAAATATPSSGPAQLHVQFNGSGSSDPQGDTLHYAWDLDGDGAFDDAAIANPPWLYQNQGSYLARLKVSDDSGGWDITSVLVTVGPVAAPPVAHITTPLSSLTWSVGDTISFSGYATDALDGTVAPARLVWTVIIRHCPSGACHDHDLNTFDGVASGTFSAPDHEYPSSLQVRLVATNSHEVSSAPVIVTLQPKTVNLTFATNFAGISIGVGSSTALAPFTRTVIVKSAVQVSAPRSVRVGGRLLYFRSWSDGLAAIHVVTPLVAKTLTATYYVHPTAPKRPPRGR